jgi:hypothetical protein
MFWIEGIGRDAEGFVLETLSPHQGRHTQVLRQLSQSIKFGQTSRIRITTDCAHWHRESGQAFWRQLGIEALKPKDGQGVFRFLDGGKPYLVPASVFLASMMRPIQHIQSFLFKPQGLESFCMPLLGGETEKIGLYLPPAKVYGSNRQPPQGLLATYDWMHCFPSAHAMWSSVYPAACNGRLDVALPQARLTVILHYVKNEGIRLVTEMTIVKLESLETPFDFAAGHLREFVLHDSTALDWQILHRPACAIQPRGREWRLSDTEWQMLEPLFAGRTRKKYHLRDIIDLILIKFGTGQAWRKLSFGELNFPIVQATYQSMKKTGQWDVLEELLQRARGVAMT